MTAFHSSFRATLATNNDPDIHWAQPVNTSLINQLEELFNEMLRSRGEHFDRIDSVISKINRTNCRTLSPRQIEVAKKSFPKYVDEIKSAIRHVWRGLSPLIEEPYPINTYNCVQVRMQIEHLQDLTRNIQTLPAERSQLADIVLRARTHADSLKFSCNRAYSQAVDRALSEVDWTIPINRLQSILRRLEQTLTAPAVTGARLAEIERLRKLICELPRT